MSIKAKLNIALKTLYNNRANIAFYGGTALTMIGTGLFVHATRKNEPVITDHKLAMALVSEDDKQTKRDICKKTVKETAKNYALPVAVSGIGYAFTFYGNITHNSDKAALNTALTGVTLAYEALKEKIISEHGVDEWDRLNGINVEHIVDAETGEEEAEVKINAKENTELFSVIFDENNTNFISSKGDNRRFLIQRQRNANADLPNEAIITLPYILTRYLGFKLNQFDPDFLDSISRAGWFYNDATEPTNYIDFGLEGENVSEAVKLFMTDKTNVVKLTFNCERDVYKAVQEYGERMARTSKN